MKLQITAILFIFSALAFFGCSEDEPEIKPEESFFKIYNDESFENTFFPVDMTQSSDSSYMILGAYDYWNTYILKTDQAGNFQWDIKLDEGYVNPIPGLFEIDNSYYFFCMDEISLVTHLFQVTDSTSTPNIVRTYNDITYPLHASKTDDGGFLILSYDRNSLSSQLDKLNANFEKEWSESPQYEVLEDVEEEIIGHVTRIGERLPFFTGTAQGRYFFNGFSNFSFSLHFVDKADGEMTGVINGFRNESAITRAVNINSNEYALSRYSFDNNFILPKVTINENEVLFSSDFGGNDHPEIEKSAAFYMTRVTVQGVEKLAVATTTKTKQIIIYIYDVNSGELDGSRRLGYNNPFEMVKAEASLDGGLTILGNTYVTGRFPRISLYKLSKYDLEQIVNS